MATNDLGIPNDLSAYGTARSTVPARPLDRRGKTDAYWRACKYLALGMIYLDNPLLKEPLKPEHIKNRLLGHWGSSPAWRSSTSI